jgi:hypothetical protein
MVAAMRETPASAAGKWASIIATLCARPARHNVFATGKENANNLPIWAMGVEDKRSALSWDTSQTIALCKINNKACLAIIDSGSYKTIMDTSMARVLGLKVGHAVKGDCGTYSVPGTG